MIKLETRLPRERHLQPNLGANRNDVSDADVALIHVGRDEVFAKGARDKFLGTFGV
jgi:hypothetical protein